MMLVLLLPVQVHAATYYISPAGLDTNSGTTPAAPWLTFAHAINSARAWCGDTLLLMNGTYGNGTSTGKLDVNTVVCTLGDELTVRAENQRQAKIYDSGGGKAIEVRSSAYIIVDGLYGRSADNSAITTSGLGTPFQVRSSNHVTIRNSVARNVNRYVNSHMYEVLYSQDILLEDNEAYVFHRHCVVGWHSERVVARRIYCNPRGGAIAGGVGAPEGLNRADGAMSMYPCRDCIQENAIADGTTTRMYLNEMNATYGSSILMLGSKVLGSICYKCNYGNGIYINSRNVTDLNHSPQNITVRDVAIVDWGSSLNGIRVSDCVGCVLDHIHVLSAGPGTNGISADDNPVAGGTATSNALVMTNILVAGMTTGVGRGFHITGFNTWSGDEVWSNGNNITFTPTPPANWTNTSTAAHGMGSCKLWAPVGAAVKGAGTGGSDIGATILYRYVNGVLTSIPLWDPMTGEFPHGAADLDNTNRVAGDSLFDIHTRLNVNTGGCSFPSGYGGGGGSSSVVVGNSTASGDGTTSLSWNMTVAAAQDRLFVCIGMREDAGNVGSVSAVDASGEALTLIKRQAGPAPNAWRAVELWSRTNPTAGSRTINVTTTGSVSGMVGRAMEFDNVAGLNTAVSNATVAPATTINVTAPTNSNELVIDCVASSSSVTMTTGTDQTAFGNIVHTTKSIQLTASRQNGVNGGVMDNSSGGAVFMAQVAVSLTAGDAPSTATLTQDAFLFIYPYGTESDAPNVLYWLSNTDAQNIAITVRPNALVRIRAQLTGSVATTAPFGVALFCKKDADPYTQAMNLFGSNVFRLYGSEVSGDIPSALTPTSNRLCSSNCVTGGIIRDQPSSYTVPALTVGQHIELDAVVQLAATPSQVVSCRFYQENGTALDSYTQTPTMTIEADAAGSGF